MKVLVMPKPLPGAAVEEMQRFAPAEIHAVWELYVQGICREFYARLDEPGRVLMMFEAESVEAARQALAMLPFVERNLIDFDLIPLGPFVGLSRMFQQAPAQAPAAR